MSLSSANTASHFWLLSNSTTPYKTTQALSRAFFVTAPNTRSTPSANEIITYDFLQQYVEANGGGNGIAEFNQVFNDSATEAGRVTLPSGGSWLVYSSTAHPLYNDLTVAIRPGGFRYNETPDPTYIAAVRIA